MKRSFLFTFVSLTVLAAAPAAARPLHPGDDPVAARQVVGAPSTGMPSAPAETKSLTTKVTSWVKNTWSSFWGASKAEPKAQPSQQNAQTNEQTNPSQRGPANAGTQTTTMPNQPSLPAPLPSGQSGVAAGVASTKPAPIEHEVFDPDPVGLKKNDKGVTVYDIPSVGRVSKVYVGKEEKVSSSHYALKGAPAEFLRKSPIPVLDSPDMIDAKTFQRLLTKPQLAQPFVALYGKMRDIEFKPKGVVSREQFDKLVIRETPEKPFDLAKYKPLSDEDMRFLSGLLLYQQGHRCAVAVGLFHSLSKISKYQAEADYYTGMCSKELGLTTDFLERATRVVDSRDPHYVKRILPEVDPELPNELVETFGKSLHKMASEKELMQFEKSTTAGNVYYILANYSATTGSYKNALSYASQVPKGHAKYAEARFLQALAEYQVGSKEDAFEMVGDLINTLNLDKTKREFQALVHLNFARMNFQEKKFKAANEQFLKIYKDHPLWLQGLQEMGWAQLMSGDYEGAIGNMYSVQSPYFNNVYKPESYVVRTIGYLNICQYGDAYKTLTVLEKQYRPWLDKIVEYQKLHDRSGHYQTLKNFIASKAPGDVDGLPPQVIREMARHKDFLNAQKALNRQSDEKDIYVRFDTEIDRSLREAQKNVTNSRRRADSIRQQIVLAQKGPVGAGIEKSVSMLKRDLEYELDRLNAYFFEIDLFNDARGSLTAYRKEVGARADSRIGSLRGRIEAVLVSRLKKMKIDLDLILENNELLRYEVFAGSGENIRYQVAGGEKGNRVPAHVLPKSKTLQWEFDGEYWEDEIGHYRSSLRNNCPDQQGVKRDHASLEGGAQ